MKNNNSNNQLTDSTQHHLLKSELISEPRIPGEKNFRNTILGTALTVSLGLIIVVYIIIKKRTGHGHF